MKIHVFFMAFVFVNALKAQTDTIYKMDGEVLLVDILEVNETSVKFLYPQEKATHSVSKNSISKVHYSSGRKQEFSESHNLSILKGCRDWEKVQISRMESEIHGLYKIDMIGAKAKGATTLSSLAKLQDRAYNKVKIETAMLGGNMAYILEQNTEEAIFGGENGPSKTPGVTLSGLAYTSRKVRESEIAGGEYKVTAIYVLQANEMDLQQKRVNVESVNINKERIKSENGFKKLNLHIKQVKKVHDYTIIYSDEKEMVLSGVFSSRQGKKKYFNVYLIKA
jgi:sporulation protein YlmC with PRC-barrel domain